MRLQVWISKFIVRFSPIRKETVSPMYNNLYCYTSQLKYIFRLEENVSKLRTPQGEQNSLPPGKTTTWTFDAHVMRSCSVVYLVPPISLSKAKYLNTQQKILIDLLLLLENVANSWATWHLEETISSPPPWNHSKFVGKPVSRKQFLWICASKHMEKLHVLLLYKSNSPHVSMVWRHDKPLGMLVEHSKNS